jgi:hypothetical protein
MNTARIFYLQICSISVAMSRAGGSASATVPPDGLCRSDLGIKLIERSKVGCGIGRIDILFARTGLRSDRGGYCRHTF